MASGAGGTLVYLIYEAGNFAPALALGAALRARDMRCFLYSPYWLPETEDYVRRAREAGLAYLYENTALGGATDIPQQLQDAGQPQLAQAWGALVPGAMPPARWRHRLAARLGHDLTEWLGYYEGRLAVARRLLQVVGATALAMAEDNVERDSACWSRAIHERGGRATVISYSAISVEEAAIVYYDRPEFSLRGWRDRLFAILHPQWRLRHRGKQMTRLPVPRALAMERLGLAPRLPWVLNTGDVDAVLVESEYMSQRFVELGVSRAAVAATGTVPMDRIAAQLQGATAARAKLQAEFGIDPAKRLLVCAIPPNQYPSRAAPEFADYAALVAGWVAGLTTCAEHYAILLAPHPAMTERDLQVLRAACPYPIRLGGAGDVIPMCDLFVASVSSTIKWALACGKPVVDYDCYRYGYDDYRKVAQVHQAVTRAEFEAVLAAFADPAFASAQASQAAAAAARFGQLDGHATARLMNAVLQRGPALG